MTGDDPRVLVSTEWLAAHLADDGLRVLDASWHMPGAGRDARAEYEDAHIPGARFFDMEEASDPASDLPHMAPSEETFARYWQALGLGDARQIVVYDSAGLFSAARAWWLFRHMGFAEVAVLDGGLPKWRAEGRETDAATPPVHEGAPHLKRRADLVRDAAAVAGASKAGNPVIVDARAAERFRGDVPEPRAGLRAGHIPGARNLPFKNVLNPDGTMKDPAALRAAFEGAGVDLDRPAITSCGSGVTAAILSLALERSGKHDHSLYDGSWTEWGASAQGAAPILPIATGDA